MYALPDLSALEQFVGEEVVLDTASPLIYVGTLARVADGFLTLTDVDVQDSQQMKSSKELEKCAQWIINCSSGWMLPPE